MSLLITTDVQCDYGWSGTTDGCDVWTVGAVGRRAPEARKAAKARGWTHRKGFDLCPEHADVDLAAMAAELAK